MGKSSGTKAGVGFVGVASVSRADEEGCRGSSQSTGGHQALHCSVGRAVIMVQRLVCRHQLHWLFIAGCVPCPDWDLTGCRPGLCSILLCYMLPFFLAFSDH